MKTTITKNIVTPPLTLDDIEKATAILNKSEEEWVRRMTYGMKKMPESKALIIAGNCTA